MGVLIKVREKLPEIDRKARYLIKYHRFDMFFSALVFSYIIFGLYTFSVLAFDSHGSRGVYAEINTIESELVTGKISEEILPTYISIPKINLNLGIINPPGTHNSFLNEALKSGIIRYPQSGSINKGNILLLGHSSSLSNVRNQAYKAFNNIEKLKEGDEILVFGGNETYIYKVASVSIVVGNEALIEFDTYENTLTLSTCNVLGKEEERIVVVAYLD